MFDIIEYLYDNYLVDDTYPDSAQLSRKLTAAGFEQDDIDQALDWLGGLADLDPEGEGSLEHEGQRHYTAQEIKRISAEGRGFLAFLESAGLLSPYAREWVIDRAMALVDAEVSATKVKWIALLAHWRLGGSLDALWLEDLVRDEDDYSPTYH